MRRSVITAVLGVLAEAGATAQTPPSEPEHAASQRTALRFGDIAEPAAMPAPNPETAEKPWSFYLSAYYNITPEGRDFVQTTFMADHDWLHLELRYNYESLDTGSAWFGVNLGGGEEIAWEFTAMVGAVFGDTTGVAPGYRLSVNWRRLEFSTEGEYVFDTRNSSDSFFYSWSELSLRPVDAFRLGAAMQRTRVFEDDREVQFGLLAGLTFGAFDATGYVFNLDEDTPTLVFAIGLTF